MRYFVAVFLICLLNGSCVWAQPANDNAGPDKLVMPDAAGRPRTVQLAAHRNTVFCFLGCECPLAKLYAPRLSRISDAYQQQGFQFIAVFSNQQDSLQDMGTFIEASQLSFPAVKDYDNRLADRLQAKRTPEIVVIDRDWRVMYRGRVDDQYLPGVVRSQPNRQDLQVALDEIVNKSPVSQPETKVEGCLIGRVHDVAQNPSVTYTGQVARILNRHCVECHRPEEIGPFALTDYEEVKGWAEMIVEVVGQGRMPPWHAVDNHYELANARKMPESDKRALRTWLDEGAPYGEAEQLPKPREFTKGWRLPRQPDRVIKMSEEPFQVPAEGVVEYQYFVVDPGFDKDVWVTAAQVMPGNASVVHHSIVFIRPPDGADFKGIGWLSAYVPGQGSPPSEPHRARRIPAGSMLVFQQHYTPVGSPQNDVTRIGLLFGREQEITEELFTVVGLEQEFEIPPGSAHHVVSCQMTRLPERGKLLGAAPHMHYRGKSFLMQFRTGSEIKTLLEVPEYDFNWQHNYRFAEPIELGENDEIHLQMTFDNSEENPFNPNPMERVFWGDQTWQEMAVAFVEVAQPRVAVERSAATMAAASDEMRYARMVDKFFERFDKNGDGQVVRSEVTKVMKHFGFWDYDLDEDNRITRDELLEAVRDRR